MQSARRLMTFDPQGIGTLLAADRLVVPLNQREYSWVEDQVEDLFHDFAAAMGSENGIHFLGSVMLTSGTSEFPEITDGQQRLATTTMLLAAFRDYFLSMGREEDARSIDRQFLFKWDREEGEDVPRLSLNADDLHFFADAVLAHPRKRKKRTKDKSKVPNTTALP